MRATNRYSNNIMTGGNGNDVILGNATYDHITGGHGDDIIVGGGGNDVMYGQFGSNVIIGGQTTFQLMGDRKKVQSLTKSYEDAMAAAKTDVIKALLDIRAARELIAASRLGS